MATYQDYLNTAFKNPEYIRAQQDYEKASKQLSDLTAQAPLYAKKKQQSLEAADPELARLRQERSGLAGQLYAQPFQARDQYKDIFDPVARERLIAQSVGNVLGQLGGTNEMISARRGTAQQQAQDALELFKSQIGAAETLTSSAKDRSGDIRDTLKDVAKTQFQEDQDTLRQRISSSGTTDTGESTVDGFINAALMGLDNPNFDLTAWAETVPSKDRDKFLTGFNQAVNEIRKQEEADKQAALRKQAADIAKKRGATRKLSPGVKRQNIPPHLLNTFQDSPVLRQYIK